MSLFTKDQIIKIKNNFDATVARLGKPNTSLAISYKFVDHEAINSISFSHDDQDHVLDVSEAQYSEDDLAENPDLATTRYNIFAIVKQGDKKIYDGMIDFTNDITMNDLMMLFSPSCPLGVLR